MKEQAKGIGDGKMKLKRETMRVYTNPSVGRINQQSIKLTMLSVFFPRGLLQGQNSIRLHSTYVNYIALWHRFPIRHEVCMLFFHTFYSPQMTLFMKHC